MDERDKNQGKAPTNDAVGSKTADTTGNSAGDAATEKDATMRRLGENHLLLNSRKGSLNATYKKNTDMKDKDLNQKSIQAVDWRRNTLPSRPPWQMSEANTRQEMYYTQRP